MKNIHSISAGIESLLFSKNLDGVIVFDNHCNVLVWNSFMERISGYTSEAALGKNLFHLCPFMQHIDEFTFIERALMGEDSLSKNRPFLFPYANTSGYYEGNYFPMLDADGEVSQVLCIFKDVTEKTLIDENLLTLTEKIRVKLSERTEELVKANLALKEEVRRRKRFGYEALLRNIELTDSIIYAREIQQAILPPLKKVKESLGEMFVFFQPRDIVSGDFYWFHETAEYTYIAAVDCTGHGVPGALISIMGYNALNQAVAEKHLSHPGDILNFLNTTVTGVFESSSGAVRDGMDISLIRLSKTTYELEYAGAFNPLFIVRHGELIRVKGNRYPIGPHIDGANRTFTNHKIQLEYGDNLYLFTDGYADQFGGPEGKKMKYNQFRDLLVENWQKDMDTQLIKVEQQLKYWKGDLEQVDDILVIGLKIQ